MNTKHYTYRVTRSPEDGEHVSLCAEFRVRIPPLVHRNLALIAAEQGVSLKRLASAKLAA
jgi:predicted HicB family RNase H-like nuclease